MKSKFIRKAFASKAPLLPVGWHVKTYSNLSDQELQLLDASKNTIFAKDFTYDEEMQLLDKDNSFAFFCQEQVMGYITQIRLAPHIVSVPNFAANPTFKGAGLTILKYYMHHVHYNTPEVLQIKCYFTPYTQTGKRLFLIYTENKYYRHSLQYCYTKILHKSKPPV